VAKGQGKGLQNPHRRFDFAPRLQILLRSCRKRARSIKCTADCSRILEFHPSHNATNTASGSRRLGLIALVVVEANVTSPMLPLAQFESRCFTGANLLTLFLYAAIGIFFFLFPLNQIQVQGYSATAAGAAVVPLILLICRYELGKLTKDRIGSASGINNAVAGVAGVLAIATFGIVMVKGFGSELNHAWLIVRYRLPFWGSSIRTRSNSRACRFPLVSIPTPVPQSGNPSRNHLYSDFELSCWPALSLASAAVAWLTIRKDPDHSGTGAIGFVS
jgi:hypothetical protein